MPERWLVDSNILLRMFRPEDDSYEAIQEAIETLLGRQAELLVATQNMVEFWSVATRPAANNGFGFGTEQAAELLTRILGFFQLVPASLADFLIWRRLIKDYQVAGTQVHDAHLCATIIANDISCILTLNDRDFRRFEPEGVLASHPRALAVNESRAEGKHPDPGKGAGQSD
jgi:predicted nucleic acid-binding protein